MMKVGNACHLDMAGVMGNSWGIKKSALGMKSDNGLMVMIPEAGITLKGNIKKPWVKRIKNLTLEAADWLAARGAVITVG